jgi:hypothetical protein
MEGSHLSSVVSSKRSLSFSISNILNNNTAADDKDTSATDNDTEDEEVLTASGPQSYSYSDEDGGLTGRSVIKVPAQKPDFLSGPGLAGVVENASGIATSIASASVLSASMAAASMDFSPWLYRPMTLPYFPIQTSFLTSKFAGIFF